jgi:hypothetical protein
MPRHVALALLASAACATTPPPAPSAPHAVAPATTATTTTPPTAPPPPAPLDPRFVPVIRAAAAAYRGWGKVDDQARLAPTLCAPAAAPAPLPRLSRAAAGPHRRKLYFLWASDRTTYLGDGPLAPGFAVVKESFEAVPTAAADAAPGGVTADGEVLALGDRRDLFVIAKVDAAAGTDQGWIYGTVAVDGAVTSAGTVATCMGCHDRDARRERLFGLAHR